VFIVSLVVETPASREGSDRRSQEVGRFWVHRSMYREGLDGLMEQIRVLEGQKASLEADAARMRRITWPQRAMRWLAAAALLLVVAGLSAAAGYLRAVDRLADAAQADAREAAWTIRGLQGELEVARRNADSPAVTSSGSPFPDSVRVEWEGAGQGTPGGTAPP
jgi:hypothetical protein